MGAAARRRAAAEFGQDRVIERTLEAPPTLVWRMWTDPEHFKAWYGPDGVIYIDSRVNPKRNIVAKGILLHELVHTRELNHSRRFWALMKKYDQQCSIHRAELRKAGQLLPEWLANV